MVAEKGQEFSVCYNITKPRGKYREVDVRVDGVWADYEELGVDEFNQDRRILGWYTKPTTRCFTFGEIDTNEAVPRGPTGLGAFALVHYHHLGSAIVPHRQVRRACIDFELYETVRKHVRRVPRSIDDPQAHDRRSSEENDDDEDDMEIVSVNVAERQPKVAGPVHPDTKLAALGMAVKPGRAIRDDTPPPARPVPSSARRSPDGERGPSHADRDRVEPAPRQDDWEIDYKEGAMDYFAHFLYRTKGMLIAEGIIPDPNPAPQSSSSANANKRKRPNESAHERKTRLEAELRAVRQALGEIYGDSVPGEEDSEVDELEEEPVGGGEDNDDEVEIGEPPRKQPVYLDVSDDEEVDDDEGEDIEEGPPRNQTLYLDISDNNTDSDEDYY